MDAQSMMIFKWFILFMTGILVALFALCVHAVYYNVHLYSPDFHLQSLVDTLKANYTTFIPFDESVNEKHICMYSTKFLDGVESDIIIKFERHHSQHSINVLEQRKSLLMLANVSLCLLRSLHRVERFI